MGGTEAAVGVNVVERRKRGCGGGSLARDVGEGEGCSGRRQGRTLPVDVDAVVDSGSRAGALDA